MLKILGIVLCLYGTIFASTNLELLWEKGESLTTFLTIHKINQNIYYDLSETDKELCSEIEAGAEYKLILADDGTLAHTLIPISEEMQIHIHREKKTKKYILDIIPVIYDTKTEVLSFKLTASPYQDIINLTKNKQLANEFIKAFQKTINFKKAHEGDLISIKYEQKVRMGQYYGSPVVLGAYVNLKNQSEQYVFYNLDDGNYYDQNGKSLVSVLYKVPLNYKRISSPFTYKRFHPVLKIYRAHLGVDFAAPSGTKIGATSDGKISFMGRKGGYGNTVIINHDDGFKSLYAHLSKFNKKVRNGSRVKQGDLIGFVGSSGVSSGPHLHFGMYKGARAMDPLKILKSSKTTLQGALRNKFMNAANRLKTELQNGFTNQNPPFVLKKFELFSNLKK